MSSLIRSFPLLVVPVAIYNAVILASATASGAEAAMARPFARILMPTTGATWQVHTGDLILLVGLCALFFEVVASSGSSNDVLLKHVLNMLLFVVCLVEFLLLKPFATSTFFLLGTLSLMATIAGFVITTVAARKDIEFAH
ncbi:MAG TPA: hypothetical protein VG839_05450 [Asticcacaulis sp.]|nr:hypothetical protein [Asticcacaulis sp.]